MDDERIRALARDASNAYWSGAPSARGSSLEGLIVDAIRTAVIEYTDPERVTKNVSMMELINSNMVLEADLAEVEAQLAPAQNDIELVALMEELDICELHTAEGRRFSLEEGEMVPAKQSLWGFREAAISWMRAYKIDKAKKAEGDKR